MFIDMHVHPDFYQPICANSDDISLRRHSLNILKSSIKPMNHIFLQMKCAGLDKYCLLARDYSVSDRLPAVKNEEIKELCDKFPDKFIGFASVDPNDPDSLTTLEYAFSELKLSGLKLHPGRQAFYPSEPKMQSIYEMCEKYSKPIIFHSGMSFEPGCLTKYSRPIEFEEVAVSYPKLRICLSHFGWPWVQETAMLMLKYPNVYADTAMLYFDSAQEFYKRVLTVDIPATWIDRSIRHQVMFGSNYPRFEQVRMAQAIDNLDFRDSTVELIKGKNALDFLGI